MATRGDNGLRLAQELQRCDLYRGLCWKERFPHYMQRQALVVPARVRLKLPESYILFTAQGFIQKYFRLVLCRPLLRHILCIIVLKYV